MFMTITEDQLLEKKSILNKRLIKKKSRIQRVKAKAQLGDEEVTPKKFFVENELHLATIPLVGKFENNSFFIH